MTVSLSSLDACDPLTISEEVELIRADEARSTIFLRRVEEERRQRADRAQQARREQTAAEYSI